MPRHSEPFSSYHGRRHFFQNLIHHLADRSQRMIGWYALLGRNVAEHSFLLVIVSAHSLASLGFLLSDEFCELKLQRNCVFQQAVNAERVATVRFMPKSCPLHWSLVA